MMSSAADHSAPLPLIPPAILRRYRVHEAFDHRFRACARLLQALWRERQGLPAGVHRSSTGNSRRIGSLIGGNAADEGRNFMSPRIAHLARREMIYQERGALIDQRRLRTNLLSSMPLAFNLFGPLRLDLSLAAKVLRGLVPELDIARVKDVLFEHSPGRDAVDLTADRSAFDVAIRYERSDGASGLVAIEMKYSESLAEAAPCDLGERYEELAAASGLFKEPQNALLRVNPVQQLFREHLLAQSAVMRGDYAEATFILIAPRLNHLVQRAATLYSAHLEPPTDGRAPFLSLELEQVIEAIGRAGELDYAFQLFDRYCDWRKIDAIVEDALTAERCDWQLSPVRSWPPARLVASAS